MHSAEDWDEVLLPEIERQQKLGKDVIFRAGEQWIKESSKDESSFCHRFRANEVRLALSLLAYNLADLWRRLQSCHSQARNPIGQ